MTIRALPTALLLIAATSSISTAAADVLEAAAAAAAVASRFSGNVPANERRMQTAEDLAAICADTLGGSMLDDAQCSLCPSTEAEGCCKIHLLTFDFSCDQCNTINGETECVEIGCTLTDGDSGYSCDGCGQFSTGDACYDFGCIPGENAVEECACNSITWNGGDCGECAIDSDGNPEYDCSSIGGPEQPSPDVGAVDNTFPYPICEDSNGEEECAEITCNIIDTSLGFECNGCANYTSGEACFYFECDSPNLSAPDQVGCTCNSITWEGMDCGVCNINYGGQPQFDCGAVGGPTSPAAVSRHISRIVVLLSFTLLWFPL